MSLLHPERPTLTILSICRPRCKYHCRVGRSPGARDRFPRVLFLAGKFPEARKAFASGSSAVPAWSFLRWVSQMLGVTGREEGPVVIQAGFLLCLVVFYFGVLCIYVQW